MSIFRRLSVNRGYYISSNVVNVKLLSLINVYYMCVTSPIKYKKYLENVLIDGANVILSNGTTNCYLISRRMILKLDVLDYKQVPLRLHNIQQVLMYESDLRASIYNNDKLSDESLYKIYLDRASTKDVIVQHIFKKLDSTIAEHNVAVIHKKLSVSNVLELPKKRLTFTLVDNILNDLRLKYNPVITEIGETVDVVTQEIGEVAITMDEYMQQYHTFAAIVPDSPIIDIPVTIDIDYEEEYSDDFEDAIDEYEQRLLI